MIYLVQLYDQVTRDVLCHGEKNFLQDGRKSFPSGHTSCNFALVSAHRL
jgi:diacylglycerol diphosphate phosphatase / phosphatidate phosphatase